MVCLNLLLFMSSLFRIYVIRLCQWRSWKRSTLPMKKVGDTPGSANHSLDFKSCIYKFCLDIGSFFRNRTSSRWIIFDNRFWCTVAWWSWLLSRRNEQQVLWIVVNIALNEIFCIRIVHSGKYVINQQKTNRYWVYIAARSWWTQANVRSNNITYQWR